MVSNENTISELKRIFELVPDLICTAGPDGYFKSVNSAFTTILGYSQEELLLTSFLELIHPDDRDSTKAEMERQLSGHPTNNFQNRYRCKNGSYKTLEWHATPALGGILYATARDITDRKLAEEAMKESERKYRMLFENMTSGFQLNEVIVDENNIPVNFRYLEGNINMKLFTGFAIEEVRGKTINEVIPDADLKMIEKFGNVALTGEAFTLEYYSNTFNKYFKVNCYSPQKGQFACIYDDITVQKEMEKTLKASEEKYRLLLENSGIGVGVYSLDGIIQLFNHKAIQHLGGKPEDYIGKSLCEVFGNETASVYLKRIKATVESKKPLEYEDYVQFTTGNYWFLSNHSKIINSDGKITGIQVLAHDITERKLIEKELRESQSKYQFIVENTEDLLWSMNPDFTFDYISPSVKNLLGYTVEEHLKHSLDDYLAPESVKMIKEEFQIGMMNLQKKDYQKLRDSATFEIELIRKDKTHRKGLICITMVRDEEYRIKKIRGITSDITERKQAEVELKQKMDELQRFYNLTVGRELKMIELKKEINELLKQSGKEEKYNIVS